MKGRLDVTLAIIASDHAGRRALTRYLERAGARLLRARRLEDAAARVTQADAALLFADEYPLDQVIDAITQLPVRLVVVVTSNVSAFCPPVTGRAECARVLVLSQRTWLRALVDAIRRALPVSVGEA